MCKFITSCDVHWMPVQFGLVTYNILYCLYKFSIATLECYQIAVVTVDLSHIHIVSVVAVCNCCFFCCLLYGVTQQVFHGNTTLPNVIFYICMFFSKVVNKAGVIFMFHSTIFQTYYECPQNSFLSFLSASYLSTDCMCMGVPGPHGPIFVFNTLETCLKISNLHVYITGNTCYVNILVIPRYLLYEYI